MSVSIIYPFTNENNYTFDSTNIEIVNGKIALKYKDNPNQQFNEDFVDDTNFIYDSDKAEFISNKIQQKDQRPTNCISFCNYEIDDNFDIVWGNGNNLVGTPGTHYLSEWGVSGGWLKVVPVTYDPTGMEPGIKGTLRGVFQVRTFDKYSTIHKTYFFLFSNTNGAEIRNQIQFYQDIDGHFKLVMCDSDKNYIFNGSLGYYEINQYQTYEIELNFDTSAGQNWANLIIDGVLINTVSLTAGIRNSTDINKQSVNHAALYCQHWAVFNEPQHTTNYTITDWSEFPSTNNIYYANTVELPEFILSDSAELKEFNSFSVTENGSPKYILDNKYWDGENWVNSDGTYTQANYSSDVSINIQSLSATDNIIVKIIFDLSSTQSSVSDLTIGYTGLIYSQNNPTILCNSSFRHEDLLSFSEVATKPIGTEIKYILKRNNGWYYHDGNAWVISNETYDQANTAIEIEANKNSFTLNMGDVHSITYVKIFLHSENLTLTPELDTITFTYDFAGETPDEIDYCQIWGIQKRVDGTADQTPVNVRLSLGDTVRYKDTKILHIDPYTLTPDSDGYWEVQLVESINFSNDVKYVFEFGGGYDFRRSVPIAESKNFWELEV